MTTSLRRECGRVCSEAKAELLHRQAKRRFGAETARQLSVLLENVEANRLIEVGDWIYDCGSGDELLERVRQAGLKTA